VVADDSGAGARCVDFGRVRGDFDYRGLPAVSAEHLGEGDYIFRDTAGGAGAGAGDLGQPYPMGRALFMHVSGGCVSGDFGIALQHCRVAAASRWGLKLIRQSKSDRALAAALNKTLHHERNAGDYNQCGSPA
jgi:hypothetical protein